MNKKIKWASLELKGFELKENKYYQVHFLDCFNGGGFYSERIPYNELETLIKDVENFIDNQTK